MIVISSVISLFAIFVIFKINGNEGSNSKNDKLRDWFNKVKSPSFNCPRSKFLIEESKSLPLVEIVDCAKPGAIYEYDFKVN